MQMKRIAVLGLAGLMPALVSCEAALDIVGNLVGSDTTTVRLVNEASSPVTVTLFFGDDQNALEAVLTEFGTEREFTLQPGDSQQFSEPCEDLQAVIIDNAKLNLLGQIGPEADTDVQRDGDDFNCGDTVTFTFDGQAIPLELNISVSVSGS
jgi:hypothetical protein